MLREYLQPLGAGRAKISPADARRGDRTHNRVQPDMFVGPVADGKRPAYPHDLHDLLLAVEVVSPINPRLDYHIKRELYLRDGVGEYWVVNPDARKVSRWRGRDDPGEWLSERIEWSLPDAAQPFVLMLPEFFDEALR